MFHSEIQQHLFQISCSRARFDASIVGYPPHDQVSQLIRRSDMIQRCHLQKWWCQKHTIKTSFESQSCCAEIRWKLCPSALLGQRAVCACAGRRWWSRHSCLICFENDHFSKVGWLASGHTFGTSWVEIAPEAPSHATTWGKEKTHTHQTNHIKIKEKRRHIQ